MHRSSYQSDRDREFKIAKRLHFLEKELGILQPKKDWAARLFQIIRSPGYKALCQDPKRSGEVWETIAETTLKVAREGRIIPSQLEATILAEALAPITEAKKARTAQHRNPPPYTKAGPRKPPPPKTPPPPPPRPTTGWSWDRDATAQTGPREEYWTQHDATKEATDVPFDQICDYCKQHFLSDREQRFCSKECVRKAAEARARKERERTHGTGETRDYKKATSSNQAGSGYGTGARGGYRNPPPPPPPPKNPASGWNEQEAKRREKARQRAIDLLKLATSPNKNEAERAAQFADELIQKWGFDRDELMRSDPFWRGGRK